jgi:hypothetical protein
MGTSLCTCPAGLPVVATERSFRSSVRYPCGRRRQRPAGFLSQPPRPASPRLASPLASVHDDNDKPRRPSAVPTSHVRPGRARGIWLSPSPLDCVRRTPVARPRSRQTASINAGHRRVCLGGLGAGRWEERTSWAGEWRVMLAALTLRAKRRPRLIDRVLRPSAPRNGRVAVAQADGRGAETRTETPAEEYAGRDQPGKRGPRMIANPCREGIPP